jgi:hypothetical protein
MASDPLRRSLKEREESIPSSLTDASSLLRYACGAAKSER